ncbi:MAG: ATP-binding protein [Rhodocyclales bacterium]|nr:ATP-binding protein [Rhodocyclales bacterium]
MNARLGLSVALPFMACAVQWMLWDTLKPYVWYLFFPAAFFSAWIGGLVGGLAATVISALLVWYIFIPPAFSFGLDNPASAFSIVVFVIMGGFFAFVFERLKQAMQGTDAALADAEAAKEKITQLYQQTLELDKLKSQFFANVSHELRTPLTLILAPLEQRLRRSASADSSETERRETEIMLRNARLLYRHVTDLLDAARIEAGRMTLTWSRLDLARLARAMASHFESLATERRIDYRVTVPETLAAEADSEKLQRVLLNLLSNAFKFTPDGGAIALRLSQDDGHALIEVLDNGPGVPAALREAVFERFCQGEADARRRHGGTGLGLSIVKDFVELHGGTVSLSGAPDGGALVLVRLPLAAPVGTTLGASLPFDEVIERQAIEELELRPAIATPDAAQAAGANAPLVLVVEDNADMNEFIATALRPSYRVACAFDGRDGMEQALALHPDLILADVMMPVMNGDEMVMALRRQPGMEGVPIVMLTARADDELRVRLLKSGVQQYVNKPFAVEELLARVGGLVTERRRTLEELRRLNADLERRVIERTAELSAANTELESFAYAVSHDLRAPLRAMSGFSQALIEDYGNQLQGEAKVYLDQIGFASLKMGEMIDGILVLSRSTRGELRRDVIDFSALATRLLEELARGEPGRQVGGQVEAGLHATGDARMIEMVLRNLLGNAWKYTGKTEAPAIRVFLGEVDGQPGICVADNGAGFDMAHADQLFQPFHRLHRQDEFPGIGIGLATVQRIIHRHGGEIRAVAAPGAGATFCFTLPTGTSEETS